jgi:hypothetical protein
MMAKKLLGNAVVRKKNQRGGNLDEVLHMLRKP